MAMVSLAQASLEPVSQAPALPTVKARLAADAPPALICRNLWKVYGANADAFMRDNPIPTPDEVRAAGLFAAVRDATLEIRQGEIFIIMGLSGSGKSTLVRCLSRLVEPTAGSVFYEHQNLLRMTPAELIEVRRHKMGMVFQNFALLPHRTVLGNVAFPLEVQGLGRKEREDRALKMIELVGLGERAGHYPRELSGGQQQRVGIARSLAAEPALWFLDEPFSALDPLIRHEMQNEFLRLQRMLSKTIVFITHDFDEAIRLGDRIAIMKDGVIIQVGTAEELVLQPASEYVSEFTRHVARSKVLTAGGVCAPVSPGEALGPSVPARALVSAVAEVVLNASAPAAVVDEDGAVLGKLEKATVIANLIGGGQ